MGKVRTIQLSDAQRKALEEGYQSGSTHAFRQRCEIILLKNQGRTSEEVGRIVNKNQITVNSWLQRYEQQSIKGLQTKAGRGRKPILDKEQDAVKVTESIQAERQRLSQAKLELENGLGKQFSLKTLKRFLKNLAAPIEGSEKE